MKFFHISDLHLGKKLRETDFLEDQIYILNQIIEEVEKEKPDGILIAGDIYDRSVPPAAAVEVFDEFLTRLAKKNIDVFIISGNHDSPERLNFAKSLLGKHRVYMAGSFCKDMDKITLEDEYGALHVYLLPFIKPSVVQNQYRDKVISDYEEAAKLVLENTVINHDERNILVAHQFISNQGVEPEKSESEIMNVGGLDNIDYTVFDSFDYVALGHIHGPQKIGRDTVRYSGTPLKYSFSEVKHKKSIVSIELKEKGNIELSFIPLIPKRDLRVIKDSLENLITLDKYLDLNREDYIRAIITDEEEQVDPLGKLRAKYPNILMLEVENTSTSNSSDSYNLPTGDVSSRSVTDLFAEFYKNQHNIDLSEKQMELLYNIVEEMGDV